MERLVQECKFQDSEQGFQVHFHNAYELLFVKKGAVRIQISSSLYTARAPALVFISNFEEHSIEPVEIPYERYYAIFSSAQADKLVGEAVLTSVFKNRPPGFCHVFDCHIDQQYTEALFLAICKEYASPDEFSDAYCAAALKQFLIRVYRQEPRRFPFLQKAAQTQIYEIQKYIEHHFTENIRIQELAAQYFMSPYHLAHTFREVTGYSPKQYLMLHRISCARSLLISTDIPIGEIAFQSGFGDVNNFIRSFKKETGITPRQYRTRAHDDKK